MINVKKIIKKIRITLKKVTNQLNVTISIDSEVTSNISLRPKKNIKIIYF